jgi:hypothetical protein
MAKLSADGKYVTVESHDTLTQIAVDYAGGYSKYKQLAAINNIKNPNLIHTGQKIYLTKDAASGSGSGSKPAATTVNKAVIDHFGLQSNADNTLFAMWTWNKSHTESYKVLWTFDTGDGVWFNGNSSTITVDKDSPNSAKQSTYNIPSNAKRVRFKVKPISETYKKNDKDTTYWDASWSDTKTWSVTTPLGVPETPSVELDKYKLTASLDNVKIDGATHIEFQVVKDNSATPFATKKASVVSSHASYAFTVSAGGEYKVRARAYNSKTRVYSEWSSYTDNKATIPSATSGITSIKATSSTSVAIEWAAVKTATKYDLEYTQKKEYFDYSDQTTTKQNIETTRYEVTGLEAGHEYFFRVRAVNNEGSSEWSGVKSVVIGKQPAAPTTRSSSTTAVTGESVTLYWVHNTEDGSSEEYAELELYVGGVKETRTIQNTATGDEKDKTKSYVLKTNGYTEGTTIQWRVRTAGITKKYGDWSVQRTIEINAPATLELTMTDRQGNAVETLTSFPFYIRGLPGPKTQAPTGYHLTITSNDAYETTDNVGNPRTVSVGDEVYSRYFDVSNKELLVEMSAGNIDLENNVEYTVTCIVSMNTGMTKEASLTFTVSWTDEQYEPNAEISLDRDTWTAYIRPYCEDGTIVWYKVNQSSGKYVKSTTTLDGVIGDPVKNARTTTGEQVYSGVSVDGDEVFYCEVEKKTVVPNITLSVYRREFDGRFTELATGLDNSKKTTVSDPHPALDYARYRIVATSKSTGAVSYYDLPGYPVGGEAVIIQWDEAWSNFETSEEAEMVQPPWSGSLLMLPYNIDVSDNSKPDVALIEYIGRAHPITYYGTQKGQTATWNVEIPVGDVETLYALRRLANWMGDVYVREPSGSGYWANITVGISQKHCDLTIPVTLDIVRVEGGV